MRLSRFVGTLGVLILAGAWLANEANGQETSILLKGGWLIDGTGAPAIPNAWVRLEGAEIAAIGEGTPPAAGGDRVIDLEGKTLLPGLADMHVHLRDLPEARWILKTLLAHGVTRVKDTGNQLGNLEAIRLWLREQTAVPRVYTSGATINGSFVELRFLKEGRETRRRLEDNAAFGAEFLKAYNWDSSQALRQMAEFAEAHDMTLTGHVPLGMTSVAGIDIGMKILEHVRLRPWEVLDDPELIGRYPIDLSVTRRTSFWAHFDPENEAAQRTMNAWEKRKEQFFLDPTIVVMWAITHADGDAERALEPHFDLVRPSMLERWRSGSGRTGEKGDNALTKEEYAEAKRATDGWVDFTGLAHSRGIRVLTGTDTPVEWVIPGLSLHQELEFFVRGGMSPVEAIHCSTGRAGEALGTPERGSIAPGQVADLVIATGNVAEDISNIRNVEKVILGGEVYDRTALLDEAADWMTEE